MRPVLRFVASVMMVSGTLLIADAAVTLLWQEPVSAYVAGKNQGTLKNAYFDPPQRVIHRRPLKGDAIAQIRIPSIGLSKYVVQGTDVDDLRKGPGHYPETPLPGVRGTVGIAGHRTTYGSPFRKLDKLRKGDEVIVEMPYATFTYRVTRTRIVPPTATYVTKKVSYDQVILSACHPLYSAAERIVVFARLEKAEPRGATLI